ncbi:MAG: BatD family protein [Candidatus Krumholzibacteria bacterium]|nr:BatD family protein [Candidatus Krumholzibacteria bacterium]
MVSRFAQWSLLIAVALSLVLAAAPAQADFTCEASVNRTSVPSGGEVVLTVAARGDVGWSPDFQLPTLTDVRIYAGGTNQSMSMINGATETSVSRTFYLKVDATEDFTIPAIKITSSKGACSTAPIAIRVTATADRSRSVPPTHSGNRTADPGTTAPAGNNSAGNPGDDIFISLEADNTEAWVGQQVVLTFRYWRRVQPWNNPSYTPPRTEGFWREDLGQERNYRKVLMGRAYSVTEIRYAIFPTRIGEMVIEPAELSFPAGVFDRFFQNRRTRQGPNVLRTDPVIITVKQLPQPHPADYSGIVASQLKLISQVDRDSVPRGEAVGLKVLLHADGFLKGFSGVPIPETEGTQLHDAGESFQTRVENDKLTGHIMVEKVVVPQQEGALHLAPVELVWFDTGAGKFRTARTAAWDLTVTPSDLPYAGDDESGFLRSEIARLGEDLAFIHQVPSTLSRRQGSLTGSWGWWLLVLLPVGLLGGYRVFLVKVAAERRDPAGRRLRGALAAAQATIAAEDEDRLSAVSRAVCGYVADCQDRTLASVGPDDVRGHCEDLNLPEVGGRLVEILTQCDAGRYGQSDPHSAEQLATEAMELVAKIEAGRTRRRASGPSGAALAILALVIGTGLVLGGSPARAQDVNAARPGADPVRLVAEGNQAYTEGRLEDAAAKYLAARDLGVNDPVLNFNLGNTYARSGHLGQAVASYLRAQRLDPGNRDVRANLIWVRRHLRDLELGDEPLPLFIAQIVAVVQMLSLDQWGLVLVVLVWGLAGMVAWGWYRQDITPGLRRGLLGTAALVLAAAVITGGRWYVEEVRETAVVVAEEVAVRSGPAENFSTLFEVHDGLTLSIVGRREGWIRVGLGGNWEGWVPAESIVPVRLPITGH